MNAWSTLGKFLILFGILLIVVGGLFLLSGKIPWLGRLPGDVVVERKNFTVYLPVTTSIIVSIVLTLLFYFFSRR
ncbi:MAG: DUF2905 domain-containing protein [bacterium]|nr:DUF2905 domain-containing protein [bacterium]